MTYSCRLCLNTVSQSRADNVSHFMTHGPRDPSINWPWPAWPM